MSAYKKDAKRQSFKIPIFTKKFVIHNGGLITTQYMKKESLVLFKVCKKKDNPVSVRQTTRDTLSISSMLLELRDVFIFQI